MREAIIPILNQLPSDRQLRFKGSDAWLVCPRKKHSGGNESSGSFKVTLDGQYAGRAYCFGCHWTGGWKEVAALFGFGKEARYLAQTTPFDIYSPEELAGLKGNSATQDVTEPWPSKHDWRGVDGKLVAALGGRLILGEPPELVLPVKIRGKQVGHVKCAIEKPDNGGLAYINKPGRWIKDALFPYDYVRKHWPQLDLLLVVEGMRDPLKPIMHGYPAVTIMGSGNWNKKCADLILGLAPERVCIMMDPDDAGDAAARNVYADLKRRVLTRVVRLPSKKDDKGRTKKLIDPFDLTKAQLEKVLSKIKW